MKKTEERYQVELPGLSTPAEVVIVRGGQQDPDKGNEVVAVGKIYLPGDNKQLHPAIRFGRKVWVGREPLNPYWGCPDAIDKRVMGQEFTAPKWSIAFEEARKWADEELNHLVQALKERIKALEDAED